MQPLDGEGDQVQVSQEGGTEPVWGPDGRRDLLPGVKQEGDVELMVATVRTTPEFSVLGRRALFSIPDIVGSAPHANYDISPDGRTFAMVQRSPANPHRGDPEPRPRCSACLRGNGSRSP